MTTLTVHTEDKEQLEALKAVLKALKIKFEVFNDSKSYDPEFVNKIQESKNQLDKGQFKVIPTTDLWKQGTLKKLKKTSIIGKKQAIKK